MTNPSVLFLYTTVDGQTKKVADALQKELEAANIVYQLENLENYSLTDVHWQNQLVILMGAVHTGGFDPKLIAASQDEAFILHSNQTHFVALNLIARNKEKTKIENNVYVREFLSATDWQPAHTEIIAGALNYTKYTKEKQDSILRVMAITKGPTDITKDYEFTDWQQVNEYAQKIVNFVKGEDK